MLFHSKILKALNPKSIMFDREKYIDKIINFLESRKVSGIFKCISKKKYDPTILKSKHDRVLPLDKFDIECAYNLVFQNVDDFPHICSVEFARGIEEPVLFNLYKICEKVNFEYLSLDEIIDFFVKADFMICRYTGVSFVLANGIDIELSDSYFINVNPCRIYCTINSEIN